LSADGGRVAVVSDRGGSPEIWITSADGRDPARRTSFGGPYLQWPAWSPDGRRLSVVALVGGNADVYLLSEGEAEPRRLTVDPAEVRAPRWSADGQALVAASNANGRWEIVRLDLPRAGGAPAQPVFLGAGISAIPSADGRALYVVKPASRGIWHRDLQSGRERLLVDDLDPMDQDNWTLTRDAIYYVARPGNGPALLRKVNLTTERATDIVSLPHLLQNSGLAVSPDERFLIFARIDRLDSDIVAIDRYDRSDGYVRYLERAGARQHPLGTGRDKPHVQHKKKLTRGSAFQVSDVPDGPVVPVVPVSAADKCFRTRSPGP
jgi:Tol biopolymer transport system component